MLRLCVHVLFACNVAIILVLLPPVTRGSDEVQNKISVNAADIGKTVQIIGRLGKPMGTLLSLRGQWRTPSNSPKPASLEFHVTHVDGKPLPSDVVFYGQVVTAANLKNQTEHEAEGVVWEMRAFEEGRFVNLQERHWEEFYSAPVSPLDYGQGPFACFLTGNVTKENRPEARRLEVGMPLDQAFAMFRSDRIECREYPMNVVPGDGSYDVRFYVIESKKSADALMIEAYQKSKQSSRIIRYLTWYHDWTSLRRLRGSDLMIARERLVKRPVKTADLAALVRFQLEGIAVP